MVPLKNSWLLGLALLGCVLQLGCAGRTLRAPTGPPPPVVTEIPETASTAKVETAAAPWEVHRSDWLTQRLFRARFATPEGKGRFRLTLRYSDPERFQISATDPLGRSLWSLFVAGSEVLLLEHREKRACSFGDELDLSSLYLGSFPVHSLPSLLLGRLPADPAGMPSWTGDPGGERELSFADRSSRTWSARLAPELVRWSVVEPTGAPLAELRQDQGWWVLADRRQDLELRWRQVVSEPLAGPVEVPAIPARYERGECLGSAGGSS